jgi:hypothetical protein
MRIVAAFLGWLRRMLDRRRARALLAKGLPRGLGAPALRPALRAPIDSAPGEYATLLLGADVIRGVAPRRLFRLAALPRQSFGLGALRLDAFRLDADLRLANEEGIPLERNEVDHRWVLASFRRQYLDLPWMAQQRIWGLSPLSAEWFWMWWEESMQAAAGAVEPVEFRVDEQLWWEMERVKEQMLIRRDVVKDENPPRESDFFYSEIGLPIRAHQPPEPARLVPPKEWVAPVEYCSVPELGPCYAEAYLQWRTLIDALGEQ